jgi:hypothetical protein
MAYLERYSERISKRSRASTLAHYWLQQNIGDYCSILPPMQLNLSVNLLIHRLFDYSNVLLYLVVDVYEKRFKLSKTPKDFR